MNNNVKKISIIIVSILAVLLSIIVLNFSIHAIRTNRFNKTVRVSSTEQQSVDVDVYGRMTGEWNKGDALVEGVTNGGTCEYTISNESDCAISKWKLKLYINQDCYLNQGWNGKIEVHQNPGTKDEKVDVVDLHNFDIDYDSLSIKSEGQGKNDLMIYLHEGDYLIYQPLSDDVTHEYPLTTSNNAATIGMIFYYDTTFNVPTYEIEYSFSKSIFSGTEFTLFIILSSLWITIFVASMVWTIVRNNSEKDLMEREAMLEETMGLITSFVDAKDAYTNGHSTRVAEYTSILAKELNFPKREARYAYYAAVLHDVGKCYVPDEILKKPGKLTKEEFDTIKNHTVYGGEMLKSIKTIKYISDGAKYHHERYDGKGYPEGLKGRDIPYIGRIICVADAFDAMTSYRCYRGALSKEYVINEIRKNLGTQFDPTIGKIMLRLIEENKIEIESWKKESTTK